MSQPVLAIAGTKTSSVARHSSERQDEDSCQRSSAAAMATEEPKPRISATFTLEPSIHSYSGVESPTLHLTLVLDYDKPIAMYADKLSIPLMLVSRAFTIHDLRNGMEVPQVIRTNCRIKPPSKIELKLGENGLLTLHPSIPVTLSALFSRSSPPRAASDPAYTQKRACGVDGLEPGGHYLLTLKNDTRSHWRHVRWWEFGTKKEILGAGDLNARKVRFRSGRHEAFDIDTSYARPVEFRCIE